MSGVLGIFYLVVVFAAIGTIFRISGQLTELLREVRGLRTELARAAEGEVGS